MRFVSSTYKKIQEKTVLSWGKAYAIIDYVTSPHGFRSSPARRLRPLPITSASRSDLRRNVHSTKPICLFAAYSSGLTQSTRLYLQFLNELGFDILFINNATTSRDDYQFLDEMTWKIFDRANVGQDIGTYKDGTLWLKSSGHLENCKCLAIVNDSMQFIPGSNAEHLAHCVREFLSSDSPALFSHVSHQAFPHYQSFFQLLKPVVFLSQPFLSFWKTYKPYSYRFHCIYKGEIEISQRVYNKLSGVTVLYSSENLHHQLVHNFYEGSGVDAEDLVYLMPSPYRTLIKGVHNPALAVLLRARDEHEKLKRSELICISDLIENSNPSHVAAFLFPSFLHCPLLKRDICFAGSFTIAQAINLYSEVLNRSMAGREGSSELIEKLLLEFEQHIYRKGIPLGYANRRVEALLKGLGTGFVYSSTYSG